MSNLEEKRGMLEGSHVEKEGMKNFSSDAGRSKMLCCSFSLRVWMLELRRIQKSRTKRRRRTATVAIDI